jgi:hypothetical protein
MHSILEMNKHQDPLLVNHKQLKGLSNILQVLLLLLLLFYTIYSFNSKSE